MICMWIWAMGIIGMCVFDTNLFHLNVLFFHKKIKCVWLKNCIVLFMIWIDEKIFCSKVHCSSSSFYAYRVLPIQLIQRSNKIVPLISGLTARKHWGHTALLWKFLARANGKVILMINFGHVFYVCIGM